MVNSSNRSIQIACISLLLLLTIAFGITTASGRYSFWLLIQKWHAGISFVVTSLILYLHEIIQLEGRIMKYYIA